MNEASEQIIYRRISQSALPVFYGFHTAELSQLLEGTVIRQINQEVPPVHILLNLAEYVQCNLSLNLYQCCAPEYTTEVFKQAELFMTALLMQGELRSAYLTSFKKVVRLFIVDTVLMNVWLSQIVAGRARVFPTVPNMLYEALSKADYNLFVTDAVQCDITLAEAVGRIQTEFRYAGNLPLLKYLEDNDSEHSQYMAQLLQIVCKPDYSKILLWYKPRKGGAVVE